MQAFPNNFGCGTLALRTQSGNCRLCLSRTDQCGLDAFILTHMQAGRSLLICPISSTGPEPSNTKLCNAGNVLICAVVTSHIWVDIEDPKCDYCD